MCGLSWLGAGFGLASGLVLKQGWCCSRAGAAAGRNRESGAKLNPQMLYIEFAISNSNCYTLESKFMKTSLNDF